MSLLNRHDVKLNSMMISALEGKKDAVEQRHFLTFS